MGSDYFSVPIFFIVFRESLSSLAGGAFQSL
jgi:hypothetical protein